MSNYKLQVEMLFIVFWLSKYDLYGLWLWCNSLRIILILQLYSSLYLELKFIYLNKVMCSKQNIVIFNFLFCSPRISFYSICYISLLEWKDHVVFVSVYTLLIKKVSKNYKLRINLRQNFWPRATNSILYFNCVDFFFFFILEFIYLNKVLLIVKEIKKFIKTTSSLLLL